jgi:hypothetical protein
MAPITRAVERQFGVAGQDAEEDLQCGRVTVMVLERNGFGVRE